MDAKLQTAISSWETVSKISEQLQLRIALKIPICLLGSLKQNTSSNLPSSSILETQQNFSYVFGMTYSILVLGPFFSLFNLGTGLPSSESISGRIQGAICSPSLSSLASFLIILPS